MQPLCLRNYSDDTPLLDDESVCFHWQAWLWLSRLVKKKACHKDALFANTFHCSPVRMLSTSTLMVRQACPFQEKHCSLFKRFHLDVRSLQDDCLRCIRITQELMLHFARSFLEGNQRAIVLAQEAGSKKMDEPHHSRGTLLINTLLQGDIRQRGGT